MTMGVEPSEGELSNLSHACGKLWDLDDNRLEPGQDYLMNLQVWCFARGQTTPNRFRFTECLQVPASRSSKEQPGRQFTQP